MTAWQAILLGLVQGLAEFLPISSSGHLVIIPHLLGWPDPGLTMDAMLHVGTLIAVIAFFWRDLWDLTVAAINGIKRRSLADPQARVAWNILVGTIPGALAGVLLEDLFERLFGSPVAAAGFLLVTALLLVVADYARKGNRPITSISWTDGLLIGIAQMLAIIPGISRSGSTISAGTVLGFRREDAARFSFLLGVPIMLGTGIYQFVKLVTGVAVGPPLGIVLLGMAAAALSGYLAIAGLLTLVRHQGFLGFAIYCAAFGTVALLLLLL